MSSVLMAFNVTEMTGLVGDFFSVIGALISGFVDLLTGDLLTLIFVGVIISALVGIVVVIVNFIKTSTSNSLKMGRK